MPSSAGYRLLRFGGARFEDCMTSEPDSTPRRRPPTIDLTATEVEAEKSAATPEAGPSDPAENSAKAERPAGPPAQEPTGGRPKSRTGVAIAGAAAGAIAVIAIGAGLWLAGYTMPPSQPPGAAGAASPSSPATGEISAELKKIEGAIQAPQPDPALASRLAAVEAATKSQADALAALDRRVDDIAATAQSALAQAKTAATAASGAAEAAKNAAQNAAQGGVARSDLDALSRRVAALDSAVKSLSADLAQQANSADDRVARLLVATEALRAAVERGAPFQAELATVKSLGIDQSSTAPLEPFAATGVPRAAALGQQLAALMPALQHLSEPVPSNGSFLGRLESNAQQLVRITPVDAPAGDDPAAVAARINVDAAHADIAAALADIGKLPAAAQTVVASWVQTAQARNAAIAAARQIAAAALAALGKPAAQ
jgi:hypothetical protein